jgi:outer membrane protein assembly factor BamA
MALTRRSGRAALVLVASAFASAAPLTAQSTHRDVSPTPEVRRLVLNGVSKSIDKDELEANIYTTATSCKSIILAPLCKFSRWRAIEKRQYLNRQELKRDVLRVRVFYYKRGFREAEVDTTVSQMNEKQVAVTFDIREGPPTLVTGFAIVADSTLLPRSRIRTFRYLRRGQPLDLNKVDSMRVAITNELWERGYADALIDTSSIVDPVAHTARVQFNVVPNHFTRVGEIVISGTDEISPTTVQNSLTFRPGDPFRRSTVLESQRNLYESNLFRLATLQVPETFDSIKTVHVLLREAQLHEARLSGGFNTVDYIQTEGRFTHYNLLGGARRLDASLTFGNLLARQLDGAGIFHAQRADSTITGNAADFLSPTWHTTVQFTQPAFLRRPRNSLGFGGFAQRRAVPAVAIDRGYGGNVTFTRTIGMRAPASLNYRFEVTRVQAGDAYFCVNFGVCDTTTIGNLRTHQRLSPVLATMLVDRTDIPLSPTSGYTARAELEHASKATVSDYAYNRAYGEGTVFMRMGGPNSVLAGHLRLGFVRPYLGSNGAVLHPRKRFYAGGSQSVRGYGENQLGPRILTLPHGFLINAQTTAGTPCDASSEAIRFCDPNTARDSTGKAPALISDDEFTPSPLGGTSLVEGSVEYRFPLFGKSFGGAVFIDGAAVGERVFDPLGGGLQTFKNLVSGTGAITPGFGIRYYSPVGPIRVDLGINPSRDENLAVVTELPKNGRLEIIPLETPRRYSAGGGGSGVGRLLNRLTLHLSIGQAF